VSPALKYPRQGASATVLLIALLALTAACGGQPRQIRGELPVITIDGLSREGQALTLDLGIRNVNDAAFDISGISLRLELDGEFVAEMQHEGAAFSITARGRELLRLRTVSTSPALAALDSLASGERSNLPWTLHMVIQTAGRRDREARYQGFLHAVPGQTDRFR
jgi:LEA14-like dessication related protein